MTEQLRSDGGHYSPKPAEPKCRMNLRTLRDRFLERWVTPALAAHVLNSTAKAKRQREALTVAERKAATTAALRAYVDSQRSQLQPYGEG